MTQTSVIGRAPPAHDLQRAVHHNPAASRAGALERLFTFAFSGLVYPQIWEDPEVDLAAMELGPSHRVVAIASGGCMSFPTRCGGLAQSSLSISIPPTSR